jgi:Ca-activated chloride channel homolog
MQHQRHLRGITLILLSCVVMNFRLDRIVAHDQEQSKPSTQERSAQVQKTDRRPNDRPDNQTPGLEAIKINTELVSLDVTVIDQKNNPVYSLNKEDFTVFEDKVPQVISSVNREEVPLSFGLVIDTSGSMRSKYYAVADAARYLIREMRPNDECFLSQFKNEPQLIKGFTGNKRELEESLDELYISGGTALLDAIIATSDYAKKNGHQRRKALVVISDGLENNSEAKEKVAKEAIKENEVQLYMVGFIEKGKFSLFGKSPEGKAKDLLERLADDSGGRAFFLKDPEEMTGVATQISQDLRTQYVISYYPRNEIRDGRYRTVRVVVNPKNNRKLIARTREGYYARQDRGPVAR